jgi:hypothetical protein
VVALALILRRLIAPLIDDTTLYMPAGQQMSSH